MRRKYICVCFVAVTFLLLSLKANAQVGQLYGRVSSRLASGETVPLAGAAVDVFRTDIPGKYQTTTDKKGEFIFAGLPYAGSYILAVSALHAQPKAISNVKAGRDVNYKFTLEPGDGRRLTMEEARAIAEDQRQSENSNEIINRAFIAGNKALVSRDFDEAIKQYDEGINADPTHPDVRALLANKSVALRSRGIARYNPASKSQGAAAASSEMEAAKKDFQEAADVAGKAVEIIKSQPIPMDENELRSYESNKLAALAIRAEAMRVLVIVVDPTQADAALAAFQEYLEVETNPAKKSKAQLDAARMLLDANLTDRALEEFQRILFAEPENVDALLGMGLAIYRSGDKNRFPEAANYLQRFIDGAPNGHPMREQAEEALGKLRASK